MVKPHYSVEQGSGEGESSVWSDCHCIELSHSYQLTDVTQRTADWSVTASTAAYVKVHVASSCL